MPVVLLKRGHRPPEKTEAGITVLAEQTDPQKV